MNNIFPCHHARGRKYSCVIILGLRVKMYKNKIIRDICTKPYKNTSIFCGQRKHFYQCIQGREFLHPYDVSLKIFEKPILPVQ